jgi:hypothetical protein
MQCPYLLTEADFHSSEWLAWKQEKQQLQLLQFSVGYVQRIVFRCIAFEIGTVNILFKDSA